MDKIDEKKKENRMSKNAKAKASLKLQEPGEKRLYEMYQRLYAAQTKKNGFPLTYEEMQKEWGFSEKSKAAASYYLPMLEAREYVKSEAIEVTLKTARKNKPKRKWLAIPDAKYNPISELTVKEAEKELA